jgi:hypothetical protein
VWLQGRRKSRTKSARAPSRSGRSRIDIPGMGSPPRVERSTMDGPSPRCAGLTWINARPGRYVKDPSMQRIAGTGRRALEVDLGRIARMALLPDINRGELPLSRYHMSWRSPMHLSSSGKAAG